MTALARPRLIALSLALAVATAHADDKRLEQTREALRRAQAALQAAQSQRDQLQQDKAKLEQDKQGADSALAKAQSQAKDAAARGARADAGLATTGAERDHLRGELDTVRTERDELLKKLEGAQLQIAEAQTRAADQRRTSVALGSLLQRSVQSLADNEKQNHALYDVGQRALGAYRQCELHGSGSSDGELPGLPRVKLTNFSEQIRRDMDALVTPATARATEAR